MAIDLGVVDDLVRSVRAASVPIAEELTEALDLSDTVIGRLSQYTTQIGRVEPAAVTVLPEDVRVIATGYLELAIAAQGRAADAIDEAFSAGTWMSRSVREHREFAIEAHRVLTSERAGIEAGIADHALGLVQGLDDTFHRAVEAFRQADLGALSDASLSARVKPASADVFEYYATLQREIARDAHPSTTAASLAAAVG